jgi:multidrug efflux pump subunit AcrB
MSSKDAMDDIRKAVRGIPGVQIIVDQNASGPPQEKPINIEISGEDVNQLATISENMIAYLNRSGVQGVEELKADVSIGKPEIEVNIDRDAARRFELSTYSIADALRTSIFGKEVSKFKVGEDDYPIFIRSAPEYRTNIENVLNQKITFRNPANGRIAQVPVSAVATIDYNSTYTSINRKEQERIITITSNVLAKYNPNEVVNALKSELIDFNMPEGYQYTFTGQQEEMAEQTAFLSKALIIALFSIFLIIVAQFNSFASPIIILLSVLFSLIGVLLGYLFTGMDFIIVMSGVGIISLAGIVVNNAIVLIDYTNLVVQRKREELSLKSMYELAVEDVKAAIVTGGSTRLRPVLLTAITTVLGLIPLAIGLNINFFTLISESDPQFFIGGDNAVFWGTMAKTVIYGLIFATFLTLIVVPVMYWLFYRLQFGFNKLMKSI